MVVKFALYFRIFFTLRSEYLEKSKQLQEQLSELRSEIEDLKVEDRITDQDRIYRDNLQQGDTNTQRCER